MAKKHVVDTVRQALAGWNSCPVYGPNELGEAPADGSPFILVQYPVANTIRTTHSPTYVEEGAARIVIATAIGAGANQAIEWGDELAGLFRFKKISGVEFKAPTSPLTHDDNDDGNYFKTSIVVPYHYHFNDPEV